jgi:hypothetical protein
VIVIFEMPDGSEHVVEVSAETLPPKGMMVRSKSGTHWVRNVFLSVNLGDTGNPSKYCIQLQSNDPSKMKVMQ